MFYVINRGGIAMDLVPDQAYIEPPIIEGVLTGYKRPEQQNDRCVVCVRGLAGNMETSWVNESSKCSFIDLMMHDKDLQDFDLYSFGYRTSYFRGAPITYAARQLANAIEN